MKNLNDTELQQVDLELDETMIASIRQKDFDRLQRLLDQATDMQKNVYRLRRLITQTLADDQHT